MGVPATREQLKTWCLRQLGFPVININVDDDQVDDRIDEALQYFREFHEDGTEQYYVKYQITSQDITNQYLPVPTNMAGVTRIFPSSSGNNIGNMFDLNYQIMLNDLPTFTSSSPVSYVLMQQHLALLNMIYIGEVPIRYNRYTDRLYVDWNWEIDAIAGQWVIMDGFIIIDPDAYTKTYNDRMLKKLATAYIKRQWGANLSKFTGMQLPGGVQMNGPGILADANAEIATIEQEIRDVFESPPRFIMG